MVSVRLSRKDEEALRSEAQKSGESLSQYIRSILLGRNDPQPKATETTLYPVSNSLVASGLAFESQDDTFVPRTSTPYITTTLMG